MRNLGLSITKDNVSYIQQEAEKCLTLRLLMN